MLEVSKKLYVNGKIFQQAILDIQIRKAEIETLISNRKFDNDKISDELKYIAGMETIEAKTIPGKL